jgi:hypothetical protein
LPFFFVVWRRREKVWIEEATYGGNFCYEDVSIIFLVFFSGKLLEVR